MFGYAATAETLQLEKLRTKILNENVWVFREVRK